MAKYRKQFFEKCLKAIVAELEHVEEQYPDLPKDPLHAAAMVSEKAGQLLQASRDRGGKRSQNLILKEATQTGAMALMLLLTMDDGVQRNAETCRF